MNAPTSIPDTLARLSRQVKAVAFAVSCVPEEGSYGQNALWGAADILHRVAAGLDDLAELSLPSLEELGEEAELIRVAQARMQNRKAEDLLFRIRQLGRFQRVDLAESLRQAVRKTAELEQGLFDLHIDDTDEDLIRKVRSLKATCREASRTLEASLGELRRLNDQVARIVPLVEEFQEESS